MSTLQEKTIVVVGGSSGIGYAVALAALQSLASVVIIASSNAVRVSEAAERLKSHGLPGDVRGNILAANNSDAVKAFGEELGFIDHIVWTSGNVPKGSTEDPTRTLPLSSSVLAESMQDFFSVRFWGPFILARHVKFNIGGSMTLTAGLNGMRPHRGSALASSVTTALDGLCKGLAVDLAPVRVNLINPGLIETEIFDKLFGDKKEDIIHVFKEKTLLNRVGKPSEIAEAYIFLMKCGYITGHHISVEGGQLLV